MCLRSDRQRLGWHQRAEGFPAPTSGARAGKTQTAGGGASGALGHLSLSVWSPYMGVRSRWTSPGGFQRECPERNQQIRTAFSDLAPEVMEYHSATFHLLRLTQGTPRPGSKEGNTGPTFNRTSVKEFANML